MAYPTGRRTAATASSSGGRGTANEGALLRQDGETHRGLFISHPSATQSWHLQSRERTEAIAAVRAVMSFANQDQDAFVNVRLPLDWIAGSPSEQNALSVSYTKLPVPHPGTRAEYDYGRLRIQRAAVGAAGNDSRVRAEAGTAAVTEQNAKATIAGSNSAQLVVTSPDVVGTNTAASGTAPWGGTVRWHEVGPEGNGFTLSLWRLVDSLQSEELTASAQFMDSDRVLRVTVIASSSGIKSVPRQLIIDAVNGARSSGLEKLLEDIPADPNGSFNFNISGTTPSRGVFADVSLSGGSHTAGGGALTNVGDVSVVTGNPALPGMKPTAVVDVAPGPDGDVEVEIAIDDEGTTYNGADVRVRYQANNANNEAIWYVDDTTGNLSLDINGTVSVQDIIDANIYETNGDTSPYTVTVTSDFDPADTVTWESGDATRTYTDAFTGGRVGAVKATGTTNVQPVGDTAASLLFTAITAGTGANGTDIDIAKGTSAGVTIDWDNNDTEAIINVLGSYTLASLATAINAVSQSSIPAARRFTASVPSDETGTTTVVWEATDSIPNDPGASLSGGLDEVREPLSAEWEESTHTMVVIALATDTIQEVHDVIVALSEFQSGTGTAAGDVVIASGATETITVGATIDDEIEYSFTGGVDGAARTALSISQRAGGRDLVLMGVLATDSIQDAIDAYTGNLFILSAASGSTNADLLSGNTLAWTNLVGGVDTIARQQPTAALSDDGTISVSLIAEDDEAQNTTLFEFANAWISTAYNDTDGMAQTAQLAMLDLSGGGAVTDPIRNQTLPTSPSGGVDQEEAEEIHLETVATGDDPHVIAVYDPDVDDLQACLDGFTAMGDGATIVVRYGTDLTADPEAVGFTRGFYDEAGGGAETADDYADDVDLTLSGTNLSLTVGRSEGSDLTDTVDLASLSTTDDYADSVDLTLTGETLGLTVGRNTGSDLTDTIDLSPLDRFDELRAELAGTGTFATFSSENVANANSAFSTTRALGFGINVDNVDRIRLQLGNTDFEFAVSEWLRLPAGTAGTTLGADSRITVVQTGGTDTIRVGRADGNVILVQFGTYTAPTTNLIVRQQQLRYSGGLIDLRVREAGGRHRVCMITRSTTEPSQPSADHFYDGTNIHNLSGSPWIQAGSGVPSGTDKIWFAFGEAAIDPLSSLWELETVWLVVDSTETSALIQYATDWTGPFSASVYTFPTHRYARIRQPDGTLTVRRIGNDLSAGRRDWVLLGEIEMAQGITDDYDVDMFVGWNSDDFELIRFDGLWIGKSSTDPPTNPPISNVFLASDLVRPMAPQTGGASMIEGQSVRIGSNVKGVSLVNVAFSDNSFYSGGSDRQGMMINFYGSALDTGPITSMSIFNRTADTERILLRIWGY